MAAARRRWDCRWRCWAAAAIAAQVARHVEGATFVAHERHAGVLRQPARRRQVGCPGRKVSMDRRHCNAVQRRRWRWSRPQQTSDTRTAAPSRVQGSSAQAVEMPPPVPSAPAPAGWHRPECCSSSPGPRPTTRRPTNGPLCSRHPVANQVRLGRNLAGIGGEQPGAVSVPQHGPHPLPPRNGGLPTITSASGHAAWLPSSASTASRHAIVSRVRNTGSEAREAVPPRPLDVSDPDRHPCQLCRVRVHLRSQHGFRPT